MIWFDGVNLGLTAISSFPVVYIVNELMNKSIQNQEEQENLKEEFKRLSDTENINDSFELSNPVTGTTLNKENSH